MIFCGFVVCVCMWACPADGLKGRVAICKQSTYLEVHLSQVSSLEFFMPRQQSVIQRRFSGRFGLRQRERDIITLFPFLCQ